MTWIDNMQKLIQSKTQGVSKNGEETGYNDKNEDL